MYDHCKKNIYGTAHVWGMKLLELHVTYLVVSLLLCLE